MLEVRKVWSERSSRSRAFHAALVAVRTVLQVLKMRAVSEAALDKLHAAAKKLGPLLFNCLFGPSESDLKAVGTVDRPKVHALVHFRYFIRRFGSAFHLRGAAQELCT